MQGVPMNVTRVLIAMGTPRSVRSRRMRSSGVSSQSFW